MTPRLPGKFELVPALDIITSDLSLVFPDGISQITQIELDQLPYYLRAACRALLDLESARGAIGDFAGKFPGQDHFMFSDDLRDAVRFATDAFFHNLRRSFDALIHYLQVLPPKNAWHGKINRSFSKLCKELLQGETFRLDPKICDVLKDFWIKSGESVTGYRDLASHWTVIASDCIARNRDGQVILRLTLPDKPENTARYTHAPGVPVMGFATEKLRDALVMVNAVLNRLVALTWPGTSGVGQQPTAPNEFRFSGSFVAPPGGGFVPGCSDEELNAEPVPYQFDLAKIAATAVALAKDDR
jgi:hypothetical protein